MRHVDQLKKIISMTRKMDIVVTDLRLNPFQKMIGILISSRTREEMTLKAIERFSKEISTPEEAINAGEGRIKELINGVAFPSAKARQIVDLSRILVNSFNSSIPCRMDDLLKLPGIGRKSANLILSEICGKPAICVDTHVHRISNRLGWVETRNVKETEEHLKRIFPRRWWRKINRALVVFGRNICKPIGRKCEICPLKKECPSSKLLQKKQ